MRQRSLTSLLRAAEAADKRRAREIRANDREMARLAKEQAKLDERENARSEVEAHKDRLDALLSVHRAAPETVDWMAVAASLPPAPPIPGMSARARAEQCSVMVAAGFEQFGSDTDLDHADSVDAADKASATAAYDEELASWTNARTLAARILNRDLDAYREALTEWDPFEETENLHATTSVAVESNGVLECVLTVTGVGIIPGETKALTSTGKLSQKAMSKRQFNELYEDYVCGCVLRAGRDLMAFLPVDIVLVTACVENVDPMGARGVVPILSVELRRSGLGGIPWHIADASDTIELFPHVGDVRSSRKSGLFEPIEPMSPADVVAQQSASAGSLGEMLRRARGLVRDLEAELDGMIPAAT